MSERAASIREAKSRSTTLTFGFVDRTVEAPSTVHLPTGERLATWAEGGYVLSTSGVIQGGSSTTTTRSSYGLLRREVR